MRQRRRICPTRSGNYSPGGLSPSSLRSQARANVQSGRRIWAAQESAACSPQAGEQPQLDEPGRRVFSGQPAQGVVESRSSDVQMRWAASSSTPSPTAVLGELHRRASRRAPSHGLGGGCEDCPRPSDRWCRRDARYASWTRAVASGVVGHWRRAAAASFHLVVDGRTTGRQRGVADGRHRGRYIGHSAGVTPDARVTRKQQRGHQRRRLHWFGVTVASSGSAAAK